MIFGELVVHTRREQTGRNAHGQPIYADVEQPPIRGASLQEPSSVEPTSDSTFRVVTDVTLYVPPGTVVKALDKMTVRGAVFEVQGNPIGQVSAFTGTAAHIPVRLKRITG